MTPPLLLGQRPDQTMRLTFCEAPAAQFVDAYINCEGSPNRFRTYHIDDWRTIWTEFPIHGSFDLVGDIDERWCVHADNAWARSSGLPMVMSKLLRCRAIRFISCRDVKNPQRGHIFEYYDNRTATTIERVMGVAWDRTAELRQLGEPIDFEDVARYALRRIGSRVDHNLLLSYARAFGFELEISSPLKSHIVFVRQFGQQ